MIEKVTINIVDERQIRALQSANPHSGKPQYAAIRPVEFSAGTGQRWEAVFWPTPDDNYTLEYRYLVSPNPLTAANNHPLGGIGHAQTIIALCMAEAEIEKMGARGPLNETAERALKISIELDTRTAPLAEVYPIEEEPTTLGMLYALLIREIGRVMDCPPNPKIWTHDQSQVVEAVLRDGQRIFHNPPPLPGRSSAHQWSFLKPVATVDTEADEDEYALPSDFGAIDGTLTFDPDEGYRDIELVSENKIRALNQAMSSATGIPRYAAVRPESSDGSALQTFTLILYPTPDGEYTLTYRYRVMPAPLSNSNPYPYGGELHSDTLRLACLSAAEFRKTGMHGPAHAAYLEQVATSIRQDLVATGPDVLGINLDRSDDLTSDRRIVRGRYTVTVDGITPE